MSTVALVFSQARFVNKAFWRNPLRAFSTFALPLMFLVIFTALLGNGREHVGAIWIKESTYYVAAMATFAVIQACFTNIAASISFQRDLGILKRIDGTPLPKSSFMGSRVLHSVLVAVMLVAITVGFGRVAYGASVPAGAALFHFAAMLVVGAAAFCALGLAITAAIPNADSAMPIIQLTMLPMMFLSGIFIPFNNSTPSWLVWVARIFPVRHFAQGMLAGIAATPFDWTDVLVVGLWGIAGLVLAVRYFTWEPRTR
ncbi:MAG TPA: ABC transporter permease [Acidimicrobiales bacterium]|nr:ABC transporter permease [Acidimicrobiales bacterium]